MTPEQKRGLELVRMRWARRGKNLGDDISSPLFLDLCADYEAASVALALWEQKPGLRALHIVDEYKRILAELEDELETSLADVAHITIARTSKR